MTNETKQKIRDSINETIKTRGGHWLKGTHLSEEHKKKIQSASIRNGSRPPRPLTGIGNGKPHTEETKEKIRESKLGKKNPKASKTKTGKPIPANSGENHYNWKGGISPERSKLGMSIEYKEWRKKVFVRDNYTCQECEQRGGELNADHIKPYCLYKELALDLENGRTLCVECHRKTDTYGWRMVHLLRKRKSNDVLL